MSSRRSEVDRLPDIAALEGMARTELAELWSEVFGVPLVMKRGREVLLCALSWQIQERRHGGFSPAMRRRLNRLARDLKIGKLSCRSAPQAGLRPGTVLLKSWRGRNYTVAVLESGFAFDGQAFGSLSEIARAITGTRWNGPAFFGLRKGYGRKAQIEVDAA